jgi:U6 snRNA-associated Sm-like protein LSm8
LPRNAEAVYVLTCDGRVLVGTLVGNDQVQNLILNDTVERVYTAASASAATADEEEEEDTVEEVELGLYVVRGDSLCLIGEYDAEALAAVTKAGPLPSLRQKEM